jgi:hypothetical protein
MSLAEALGPVLGGLFVQPVNRRVKHAVTKTLGLVASQVWTAPKTLETLSLEPDLSKGANLAQIQEFYKAKWRVAEENGGVHVYMLSARGLFCLHLPTGSIVQGIPWNAPQVLSTVKVAFDQRQSEQDRDACMQRFQINSALNMLLKDVKWVLSHAEKRETVPTCVQSLVNWITRMQASSGPALTNPIADIEKEMFTGNKQQELQTLKTFLKRNRPNHSHELFFKDVAPDPNELLHMPLRMGMICHTTVLGLYVFAVPLEPLSAEASVEEKQQFEKWNVMAGVPASLSRDGKWLLTGRIRYTIKD